jgi:hypothetical protein
MAGADQVWAWTVNDDKEETGRYFGMTDFVNPTKVEGDLVAHLVRRQGWRGYTFDATGNAKSCCHGRRTGIIASVAPCESPRYQPVPFNSDRSCGAGPRLWAKGARTCPKLWTGT